MGLTKAERFERETSRLRDRIRDQRDWIEHCGGNLSGYVARYGDSSAPYGKPVSEGGRYGNGGQLIYEADTNVLKDLLDAYQELTGRKFTG